jgi:hypothetical protein
VPTQEIFEALRQAKHAGEFFELSAADTLECAELMVRYSEAISRRRTTSPPDAPPVIAVLPLALPHRSPQLAGVH